MMVNAWQALVGGRPGRRFVRYHEQVQKPGSYPSMAVGIALVALGLVLALTPGPGLVVALLGAGILAGQSRRMACTLDRWELRVRKAVRARRGPTEGRASSDAQSIRRARWR